MGNKFHERRDMSRVQRTTSEERIAVFQNKRQNIAEVASLDVLELSEWIDDLPNHLNDKQMRLQKHTF